jgi:hypothetical protein
MSTEKLPEWALTKAKAVFDKIPGAIAEEYSIKHICICPSRNAQQSTRGGVE